MKLLLALLALLALPAQAAEMPKMGERTQETVPVDGNRFLIFVGAPDGKMSGYTVDMIQIEEGIPFYVPLFIEDYDPETNTAKLGYGVAFYATSYRFDRANQLLDIRTLSEDGKTRYDMRYKLDTDILHLKQVTAQAESCTKDCKPKTLFTGKKK